METMIKAVLFDFGQTLVDSAGGFRAAERQAQQRLFKDLRACSAVGSWEAFIAVYRSVRKQFHDRSNFSRVAIWREVYAHFEQAPDVAPLTDWEQAYWDTVTTETRIFPEARQTLGRLQAQYRIALITNTQGQKITDTHRLSQFPELAAFFEVIIVAGEAGIASKPDPAPFNRCLMQLKLAPAEAVYVGDDWRNDVCGAQAVGIRPVWLQHHSVQRNWPQVETVVPVIRHLDALLDLPSLLS